MVGKVCVVTGANAGIGRVTALELARMGATVVLVCRNPERGAEARAAIVAQSGNSAVELLVADFASLASVRGAAETLRERYPQLHVLVNNAGLYLGKRLLSDDGYEQTFAVNHLAPFLLTNLLLDALKAGAPARVVTVSSVAHFVGTLRFDDLQSARSYSGFQAYATSKLCNVLFTYELARRLAGSGVAANCLHPGAVASHFALGSTGLFGLLFQLGRPFFLTPEQGAQTSLYLAASPAVEGVSGGYFANRRPSKSSSASHDRATQEQLWAASEELTGLRPVFVAAYHKG